MGDCVKSHTTDVNFLNRSQTVSDLITKMRNTIGDIEKLIPQISNKDILHETKDADIQTNSNEHIFSLSVATQTVNPISHIAVQTEYDSPGGFHISSTAMFNIQPGVAVEAQTDPLCCLKCNSELCALDTVQVATNQLSADQKLIKHISNKYTLSGSFDNIDFDTQDIIKGKEIADQKEEKSIVNKSLDLEEEKKAESMNIVPQTSRQNIQEKKSFKRIRKPSTDSDSDSSEEVPVKARKNKFVDEDLSIHFESELQKVVPDARNDFCGFTFSEGSDDINYKEVLEKIIRKCENTITSSRNRSDEYSTPKRARIREHVSPALPAITQDPPTKRSKTQDVIKECELIIREACSGTLNLEDSEHSVTIKEPSKLTLAVLEEEFENNFSNNVAEHIIRENVEQNANVSKTKKQFTGDKFSESLFTDDNCTNYSFAKSEGHNNKTDTLNNLQPCLNDIIDDFNKMDDSFENDLDNEVAEINNTNYNQNSNEKVRILEDITVLDKKTISKDYVSVNVSGNGNVELNDENILRWNNSTFSSDSEPEVVESTPQKTTSMEEIALLSQQNYYIPDIDLPPVVKEYSENVLETYSTKPCTPPPEFQDFTDVIENKSNTEENIAALEMRMSSLTPELLLPQNSQQNDQFERKRRVIASTPFTQPSQVISTHSLNLSPIKHNIKTKSLNPLHAAQRSKNYPLTLVRDTTPTSHLLSLRSSTPKQRSILSYINLNDSLNVSQRSSKSTNTPTKSNKPNVTCTRLNKEQLLAVTSLSNKKLITYSSTLTFSVTHLIVAVNENRCIKDHTMKFVRAVATGIWVLSFNWIEECLKQGKIIREEPFEALDVSGLPGPQQSRLHHLTNPLLKNFKIFAAPPFAATTQHEIENVITLLGGEIVSRPEDLMSKHGKICLIVTEARGSQDFELYEIWLKTLHVITVDLEWLSRTVGQYQLQSLRSFSLCSEDSICDLGYPSELLEEVPFSFSQTSITE